MVKPGENYFIRSFCLSHHPLQAHFERLFVCTMHIYYLARSNCSSIKSRIDRCGSHIPHDKSFFESTSLTFLARAQMPCLQFSSFCLSARI